MTQTIEKIAKESPQIAKQVADGDDYFIMSTSGLVALAGAAVYAFTKDPEASTIAAGVVGTSLLTLGYGIAGIAKNYFRKNKSQGDKK